ncbi:MAG: anhydro-N-acetylmuramic acid kinase [Gemmatimonadaceae bacterium]|nr:anhydro-N-acetylmuramic acid kinase [Gemmatimonadaceae bacterium]
MILVGLMSGTSLDGISAAVVRFSQDGARVSAELLAWDVAPYTATQRERLGSALVGGTPETYCRLNVDLGEWLAAAAQQVIAQAGVPRADIAGIASHGQTIWHIPDHSTWQTGESAVIAERTGLPVISDFRVRDMAAGGQGAPLVPIADRLLFADPRNFRALQNLGGIGNVTIVPPGGDAAAVRAFDTGPGVVVIDGIVRQLDPSRRYDEDGRLARAGTAIPGVVAASLGHAYFSAPPPKSTGRELFTPGWIAEFMAACRRERPGASDPDLIATAVEFTAASIADSFARFVPEPVADVVVSGGGARNPALVDAIARRLAPRRVVRFDELFFDGEAKEAVAFALLGYLHLTGQPGNVPGATGARGPRVLGKRTPA